MVVLERFNGRFENAQTPGHAQMNDQCSWARADK